jgi:hypothetical protein
MLEKPTVANFKVVIIIILFFFSSSSSSQARYARHMARFGLQVLRLFLNYLKCFNPDIIAGAADAGICFFLVAWIHAPVYSHQIYIVCHKSRIMQFVKVLLERFPPQIFTSVGNFQFFRQVLYKKQ